MILAILIVMKNSERAVSRVGERRAGIMEQGCSNEKEESDQRGI